MKEWIGIRKLIDSRNKLEILTKFSSSSKIKMKFLGKRQLKFRRRSRLLHFLRPRLRGPASPSKNRSTHKELILRRMNIQTTSQNSWQCKKNINNKEKRQLIGEKAWIRTLAEVTIPLTHLETKEACNEMMMTSQICTAKSRPRKNTKELSPPIRDHESPSHLNCKI